MVGMKTTQKHQQYVATGLLVCQTAGDLEVGDEAPKQNQPSGENQGLMVHKGNLIVILLLGFEQSLHHVQLSIPQDIG